MLRSLHISNLAIIAEAAIELAPGLNVFTGQTGAGKSLILGALELLLGLRGGGEDAAMFVRPGADEARVSGTFELADPQTADRIATILDQTIAASEPVLITRRVMASGRSSVSVNGLPATANMLRDAGALLVDIHGQHDQQFLLKPANQLAILDAFADAIDARKKFADLFTELRASRRRLTELHRSQQMRADQLELYRFQLDEIDAAAPQPGEYEQTRNRYNVLKNLTHLQDLCGRVLEGLSEGDDTALDRVGTVSQALRDLARLDTSLGELSAQAAQAQDILQDVAQALARYLDTLEIQEGEFEQTEQRLDVLNQLIHKYARTAPPGTDAVAAVLEYRNQTAAKIEQLQADAQTLEGLDERITELRQRMGHAGKTLTKLRSKAAKRLKTLIEQQLRELEMDGATFDVQIVSRDADDDSVEASGLDDIEFLVRTNPGQERLPLRKIASGGEMSRIMLAVKTILADKDQITVLVFDEIDANIGDRLGATIGRKMRALAHGPNPPGKKAAPPRDADGAHQIICITHLSQIAACADHHLQIAKQVVTSGRTEQTLATVRALEGSDRIRELAEMMAGKNVTDSALTHAQTLLAQAQEPVGEARGSDR